MSEASLDKTVNILERTSVVLFEWTLDPEVPTKYVSNNISAYGYTPDDFYKGTLSDYWSFIYEEDRERAKKTVYDARARHQKEVRHSYRVVCKNGRLKWVEELVIFDKDEAGELISEKGILYDITKQKQMEEVLAKSERKYRTLFEKGPGIMMQMDREGNIVTANKAALSALEYKKQDLIGQPLLNFAIESPKNKRFIQITKNHLSLPLEMNFKASSGQLVTLSLLFHLLENDGIANEIYLFGQNITQKKEYEDHIKFLSYHDKLSGLYNRTYFDECVRKIQEENNRKYAIIIGDVNGLKETNDLFGHKVGDELLKAMADILTASCRQTDIVCRIGGDEFAILLPDADDRVAKTVCDRVRESCEEYQDFLFSISIALGYSSRLCKDHSSEMIIKEADDKMYKNKLNLSKSIRSSIVTSLKASLEEKTMETNEHGQRIQKYTSALGKKIGLTDAQLDELLLAAMFHDIGKIGVPDSILLKPGALEDDEWEVMKKHCDIGFNILNASANMSSVAKYVLHHHERWDGSGYPSGLKGDAIPLLSRMIAIADAYDVMTTDRVYSRSMSPQEAIDELIRCKGTQFDPEMVDAFIACLHF